jgi:transcriptional regulator with XRE-family HTH domain
MFRMGNNIVGERVRLARRLHSPTLTQAALAAKLQLAGWDSTRVTIAKIETGLRQVNDIEVLFLAKALNVSPNWLFGIEK